MAVLIRRERNTLVLSFRYDPNVVAKVKGLPVGSRRWEPNRKIWIVPISAYPQLVESLQGVQTSFEPPELPQEIEAELNPGQNMSCYLCKSSITCDDCKYLDSCPVKFKIPHCFCPNCMENGNLWEAYTIAFAERLEKPNPDSTKKIITS